MLHVCYKMESEKPRQTAKRCTTGVGIVVVHSTTIHAYVYYIMFEYNTYCVNVAYIILYYYNIEELALCL